MRRYVFTGRESDEDFYLIPAKLSREIIMLQLNEIIAVFAKNGRFIPYQNTYGFFVMFSHMLDGVKVFCDDHRDDGVGEDVCKSITAALEELQTDDDRFPEDEIGLVSDIMELCSAE